MNIGYWKIILHGRLSWGWVGWHWMVVLEMDRILCSGWDWCHFFQSYSTFSLAFYQISLFSCLHGVSRSCTVHLLMQWIHICSNARFLEGAPRIKCLIKQNGQPYVIINKAKVPLGHKRQHLPALAISGFEVIITGGNSRCFGGRNTYCHPPGAILECSGTNSSVGD